MQVIYNYMPNTNHVSRVQIVAALLYLQFVLYEILFRILNIFCTFILVLSIRKKTGAQNIAKEIKQHHQKWLQHVQRIDTNKLPKQALHYRPKG
jgi:cytochrome b subunit of formate dehydrogenase